MASKGKDTGTADLRLKNEKLELEKAGLLDRIRKMQEAHGNEVATLKDRILSVQGQKDRSKPHFVPNSLALM